MTEPFDLSRIPPWKLQRLVDSVMALHVRCIECGEHLTQVERFQNRAYCTDCWSNEPEEREQE